METWRPVPGFVNVFASSLGYIKWWHRTYKRWWITNGSANSDGYLAVKINGRSIKVHRLVGLAFHGVPDVHGEINHKDGLKVNNSPDNLEWCDRCHNMSHAVRTGLKPSSKGTAHGMSKLTDDEVKVIYSAVVIEGRRQNEVARSFCVTPSTVWLIVHRKHWKHLNLSTAMPAAATA